MTIACPEKFLHTLLQLGPAVVTWRGLAQNNKLEGKGFTEDLCQPSRHRLMRWKKHYKQLPYMGISWNQTGQSTYLALAQTCSLDQHHRAFNLVLWISSGQIYFIVYLVQRYYAPSISYRHPTAVTNELEWSKQSSWLTGTLWATRMQPDVDVPIPEAIETMWLASFISSGPFLYQASVVNSFFVKVETLTNDVVLVIYIMRL